MQTETKNIEQETNNVNLKTSNRYMFNLIQSTPQRVKFRDTIDIATIRNDTAPLPVEKIYSKITPKYKIKKSFSLNTNKLQYKNINWSSIILTIITRLIRT